MKPFNRVRDGTCIELPELLEAGNHKTECPPNYCKVSHRPRQRRPPPLNAPKPGENVRVARYCEVTKFSMIKAKRCSGRPPGGVGLGKVIRLAASTAASLFGSSGCSEWASINCPDGVMRPNTQTGWIVVFGVMRTGLASFEILCALHRDALLIRLHCPGGDEQRRIGSRKLRQAIRAAP